MNINSVKRVFASVRSIINLNIREYGLDGTNAFSGTYMPDRFDASKRKPIPDEILKVIQSKCQITDDEPRWLIALISDTGMRLSEAAGLSKMMFILMKRCLMWTLNHIRGGVLRQQGSSQGTIGWYVFMGSEEGV